MAGELREENMRNAETANIWSIQTEKKKKKRYSSAEVEKKKKDAIFPTSIPPALGSQITPSVV